MTDVPPPATPTDLVPGPAAPPGPPTSIADGTGPMWSVVDQHGLVQRPSQQRATGLPKTSRSILRGVSCFNVLMGEDLNLDAKPAKIVSSLPGDFCLGYFTLPNISSYDIMDASLDLPTKYGGMFVMLPHLGISVLSWADAEDLATACKSQLFVKGVPLQTCRVIAKQPRLFRVSIRGFKPPSVTKDSIIALVKRIDAAMTVFGVVKDLVINVQEYEGRYGILDNAWVTILLNDEKNLPSTILIDNAT
ncbi:hypothetical protein LPJ81_005926, partial [Coemansia sp. IMI 209127]